MNIFKLYRRASIILLGQVEIRTPHRPVNSEAARNKKPIPIRGSLGDYFFNGLLEKKHEFDSDLSSTIPGDYHLNGLWHAGKDIISFFSQLGVLENPILPWTLPPSCKSPKRWVFMGLPLRGSGYLGYVDSNQGFFHPYKWVICPLTRVINLHITSY